MVEIIAKYLPRSAKSRRIIPTASQHHAFKCNLWRRH